jgi:hypothetical protein
VAQAREIVRRWAWAPVLLGLLVMALAGMRATRYRPGWFDPDDGPPCSSTPGGCPADLDAVLRGLWWWVGVGGVLVGIGVALTVWRCSAVRGSAPARGLPVVVHALVVGLCGGGLLVPLTVPLLLAGFMGPHAVPSALVAVWLIQAGATAGLGHALGAADTSARRAWLTGLVAGAAALAVAGALFLSTWTPFDPWWTVPLTDGATLALTVVLLRLLTDHRDVGRRALVMRAAGVLGVLVVAGAALTTAVVAAREPDRSTVADLGPAPPVPLPTTEPPAPLTVAPLPPPAPTPAVPSPPTVDAAVPCAQEDLRFVVTGFDAAMGARATSLQATNIGTAPCWVQGTPVVTVLQGGRPLGLTVEAGRSPTGGPAVVQRVGIAPSGSAFALLTWRTYAGWADGETRQTVTAALDPASPAVDVPVNAPYGPAPFDIADGGIWAIAPWAPPRN